jgi:zinc-binding alcohol dehydrogenase family protein
MRTMKAIGCEHHGGVEALAFHEVEAPDPTGRDLRVRVHASALNPVDLKVVSGTRGAARIEAPPLVPGYDASGVVDAVGDACRLFRPGDSVYLAGDIGRRGSHAEYVLADERLVGHKPRTLTHPEAAALPLTALTAWELLVESMGASVDGTNGHERLLVIGGGGGVGSIAIQIARRVCALDVVATASREASRALCRRLGATHVLDHTRDLVAESRAVGIESYDYVLATCEPDAISAWMTLLAPFGRLGLILPPRAPIDLAPLFPKRASIHFELMFTRPRTGIELERQGAILDRVSELVEAGELETTCTRTIPWTRFQEGYQDIQSGHGLGKTVLVVRG